MSCPSVNRSARVLLPQQRPDPLLEDPLRRREHVQPPDAGQVRFEELESALPLRALEEHHRVEPSEDRVRACVERGPAVADPLLVTVGNRERRPDIRVHQPQLEQAAGRIVQRQRRRVEVCLLLRQDGERRREDGHRLRAALVQVEETRGAGRPRRSSGARLASAPGRCRAAPTGPGRPPAGSTVRAPLPGSAWRGDSGRKTDAPGELRAVAPQGGRKPCVQGRRVRRLRRTSAPRLGWSKLSCPDHAPRLRLCFPAVRSASRPAR